MYGYERPDFHLKAAHPHNHLMKLCQSLFRLVNDKFWPVLQLLVDLITAALTSAPNELVQEHTPVPTISYSSWATSHAPTNSLGNELSR